MLLIRQGQGFSRNPNQKYLIQLVVQLSNTKKKSSGYKNMYIKCSL